MRKIWSPDRHALPPTPCERVEWMHGTVRADRAETGQAGEGRRRDRDMGRHRHRGLSRSLCLHTPRPSDRDRPDPSLVNKGNGALSSSLSLCSSFSFFRSLSSSSSSLSSSRLFFVLQRIPDFSCSSPSLTGWDSPIPPQTHRSRLILLPAHLRPLLHPQDIITSALPSSPLLPMFAPRVGNSRPLSTAGSPPRPLPSQTAELLPLLVLEKLYPRSSLSCLL